MLSLFLERLIILSYMLPHGVLYYYQRCL